MHTPGIPLDNDYEFEYTLTQRAAATGLTEAAAGLTGLTARISATDGGAAVHANLSVAATERASKPGTYYGVFQGNDLRSHAATLAGSTAYIVFGDGTNVLISEPKTIIATRRI